MIPDWAEVQQQDAFSPLQLCCDVKIWFLQNQYFTFYATVNPKIEQWDNLLQINILESLVSSRPNHGVAVSESSQPNPWVSGSWCVV